MTGNLIPADVLNDIDRRVEALGESERKQCVNLAVERLRELGIAQSTSFDEDNRERLDEVIDNYHNALLMGRNVYHGDWDNLFLAMQEVAGAVEPSQRVEGETYAPFRRTLTAIPGIQYVPPADETRIRRELEKVRRFVLTQPLHPVEETAFLYFHIARVQPFDSGNKRTASVIMNTEHEAHGYPYVAVGPKDEQGFARRFGEAIEGYREDMSSGQDEIELWNTGEKQRQFFGAWGRRMLDALETVRADVDEIPRYKISMKTRQPGREFAVKKAVQSRLDFNGGPCEVLLRRSENALYVSGHVDETRLSEIVDGVGGVKYRIERVNGS